MPFIIPSVSSFSVNSFLTPPLSICSFLFHFYCYWFFLREIISKKINENLIQIKTILQSKLNSLSIGINFFRKLKRKNKNKIDFERSKNLKTQFWESKWWQQITQCHVVSNKISVRICENPTTQLWLCSSLLILKSSLLTTSMKYIILCVYSFFEGFRLLR